MLRNCVLFAGIFIFVLFINSSIIFFNMMYPEQPLIYLANQSIHSLGDLFAVYLNPKMFHMTILFFRPSGHFLLYQLLAPFIGWHNTQALIVINLGFLALSGLVLLKLYQLLFPSFKVGAYIALAVYLMHPALMLSRLIILHFEFAYVFFSLLSIYYFVLYCQRGMQSYFHLSLSLLFFIIAVSFKEPAIFLGPVLFVYLLCHKGGQLKNQKSRQILALLTLLSLSLALYLSLQWPSLHHPLRSGINFTVVLGALHKLICSLFGLPDQFFDPPVWRNVIFPKTTSWLLWVLVGVSVFASLRVYWRKTNEAENNKRSLSFLYLAALIFLILPVCWGWGLPWHLSLSLLFVSLIMGFSCEYLARVFIQNKTRLNALGYLLALGIGLSAINVNQANINYLSHEQGFPLTVASNAVFHPPQIQQQLNKDSVVVVEDSSIHDAYLLGASMYPYFQNYTLASPNLDADQKHYALAKKSMFIQQQLVYNGTLFRWAYLMPELQEEVYPFQVEKMQDVPDLILYNWLRHYDNIFCLGYDAQGEWHDRSELFKKNLLLEQEKRHLIVNQYDSLPATAFEGNAISTLSLSLPEPQICQQECDGNAQCKGFTYINMESSNGLIQECLFYGAISREDQQFCAGCEGFVKR